MDNYKDLKFIAPFVGWVLHNFPYLEQDFDSVTTYQMIVKMTEKLNETIQACNDTEANQAIVQQKVQELETAYQEFLADVDSKVKAEIERLAESGYVLTEERANQLYLTTADLADYVTRTDYGSESTAGVYKVSATSYGIGVLGGVNPGVLYISPATDYNINNQVGVYNPLTAANISKIVKVGTVKNTIALTDAEKTSAQSWLGITSSGVADTLKPYSGVTSVIIGNNDFSNSVSLPVVFQYKSGTKLIVQCHENAQTLDGFEWHAFRLTLTNGIGSALLASVSTEFADESVPDRMRAIAPYKQVTLNSSTEITGLTMSTSGQGTDTTVSFTLVFELVGA